MPGASLLQTGGAGLLNGAGAQNPAPFFTVITGIPCVLNIVGVTIANPLWAIGGGGPNATLSSTTSQAPQFTPDLPGNYEITLSDQLGTVYSLQLIVQKVATTIFPGPNTPAFVTPTQVATPLVGNTIFCDSTNSGKLSAKNSSGATYELNPTFDVRTFGAKGNGSTDDTTAIRNAIAAAKAAATVLGTGCKIYFPFGNYVVTGTLTIDQHRIHLEGDGLYASTITFIPVALPAITAVANTTPISVTATAHGLATGKIVTIEGTGGVADGTFVITNTGANTFTLNGTTANGTASAGTIAGPGNIAVDFTSGAELFQCSVKHISFLGAASTGKKIAIRAVDNSELKIEDVSVQNWNTTGWATSKDSSIGIQLAGRELTRVNRVSINADRPVSIENNPLNGISCDHASITDAYLIAYQIKDVCLLIKPEVNYLLNFCCDGVHPWVSGLAAVKWDAGVKPSASQNVKFRNIRWEQSTGSSSIVSATNATPIVVETALPHQRTTGDTVVIESCIGNTNANGSHVVTVVDSTHFSLNGTTGNGVYGGGGTLLGIGTGIYINRNVNNLSIDNCSISSGAGGGFFRNVSYLTLSNVTYENTGTAYDFDLPVNLLNVFAQAGSTTNGQQFINGSWIFAGNVFSQGYATANGSLWHSPDFLFKDLSDVAQLKLSWSGGTATVAVQPTAGNLELKGGATSGIVKVFGSGTEVMNINKSGSYASWTAPAVNSSGLLIGPAAGDISVGAASGGNAFINGETVYLRNSTGGEFMHAYIPGASRVRLENPASTIFEINVPSLSSGKIQYNGTTRFWWDGTGIGFFGVTPAARQTYTTSNHTDSRTLNETAATLVQVANVVGTIIKDMQALGLMA